MGGGVFWENGHLYGALIRERQSAQKALLF
jgi:hypothetical protein